MRFVDEPLQFVTPLHRKALKSANHFPRIRFTFTQTCTHTHTYSQFENCLLISKRGVKITQGWFLFLSLLFILQLWKCKMVPAERSARLWETCDAIIALFKEAAPSSMIQKGSFNNGGHAPFLLKDASFREWVFTSACPPLALPHMSSANFSSLHWSQAFQKVGPSVS